jgi:phosphatidylserine/phosphatidylglycerophosphate/cardiolipin synthase-like enzyme
MIQSHFGDIRQIIVENLKQARHDIYVAVAWITDRQLFQLLLQKLSDGIDVKIVLIQDEINLNNGFDYSEFIQKGGLLFWDNHHHKFCVIDRKIVITGSYN